MQSEYKKIKFLLPAGFPAELENDIKLLVYELLIGEALEALSDDQAKVFYQLIKDNDDINYEALNFLEEKKPGLLSKIFQKIEKHIGKIIAYKFEIIYE